MEPVWQQVKLFSFRAQRGLGKMRSPKLKSELTARHPGTRQSSDLSTAGTPGDSGPSPGNRLTRKNMYCKHGQPTREEKSSRSEPNGILPDTSGMELIA